MTATILEKILEGTHADLNALREDHDRIRDNEHRARSASPARGFKAALNRHSLIAEVKKASPSKGVIREDFDPVAIAKAYEAGGAHCLSVLTETAHFQGHLSYLSAIRDAVELPLLRKDFIIDELQIAEARAHGADAVLLIVAAIPNSVRLHDLRQAAESYGMDALIEVHDREELQTAVNAGASLIGINNRNLHDFTVHLETTLDLLPHIPTHITTVAESGIADNASAERLWAAGVHGLLVGESLMRADDIVAATRAILGKG